MDKLPQAWTERIFERLQCIFKDKWIERYQTPASRKDIYLAQWSSGLAGLTAHEIQKALTLFECYPHSSVPTVMEFYHYAKGATHPHKAKMQPTILNRSTPQDVHRYILEIQQKLKRKTFHVEQSEGKPR